MKQNQQSKEYKTPKFQFVKQDEQNKVFFSVSDTPGVSSLTGGINSMSIGNSKIW